MRLYHYNNKTKEYMGYIDTDSDCEVMVGYTHIQPPTEYIVDTGNYVWNGNEWETILNTSLLSIAKETKISELKAQWGSKEIEPIEYNGNKYDYDYKSQTRIMSANTALTAEGKSAYLMWTTADNGSVKVKAADLKAIISLGAKRSDTLHSLYNKYKEQVQNVETYKELQELVFDWKEEE